MARPADIYIFGDGTAKVDFGDRHLLRNEAHMSVYDFTYQCCGKVCTLLDHPSFYLRRDRSSIEYKICSAKCLKQMAERILANAKSETGT